MEGVRPWLRGAPWVIGAFILTLILRAPAAWLPLPSQGPVSFSGTAGHLLRGESQLTYRGQGLGTVRWDVGLPRSLDGVPVTLSLQGPALQGTAEAELSPSAWRATVQRLTLDSRALKDALAPYAIAPEGTLQGRDLMLSGRGNELESAAGALRWTGGLVRYRLGGNSYAPTFPPLSATLAPGPGGQLEAEVSAPSGPVLSLALRPGGWVDLAVRRRLLRLADFPAPEGVGDDTVLLELSERVL
jgi:hypothetical protein